MLLLYILPKKLRNKLRHSQRTLLHLMNVVLTFLLSCALFALGYRFFEKTSWIEAIWQTWQTATTVGYGNAPAQGLWGRLMTMFFGTITISYLPIIIGYSVDFVTSRREKIRMGLMENTHKNGYILFNFPGTAKTIKFISEIRRKEEHAPICIIDSRLEELPKEIIVTGDVRFIKGGLLDRSTYERANLGNAKAVIVFPFESGVSESDSTTETITKLVSNFINPDKTRIIHVLVDPDHAWLFAKSISTQVIEEIGINAIVQECQDKYSARIIEKLLSNKEGANPHTVVPDKLIGWSWSDFTRKMLETSHKHNLRINTFALVKNGIPDTCPTPDTKIEQGDYISILTHIGFNWEKFVELMMK